MPCKSWSTLASNNIRKSCLQTLASNNICNIWRTLVCHLAAREGAVVGGPDVGGAATEVETLLLLLLLLPDENHVNDSEDGGSTELSDDRIFCLEEEVELVGRHLRAGEGAEAAVLRDQPTFLPQITC